MIIIKIVVKKIEKNRHICSSSHLYSKISLRVVQNFSRLVLFVFTISDFKMFLFHDMFFTEEAKINFLKG